MRQRWSIFLVTTVALWLLAHAIALFCHEFAHTFSALALGWKHNPFDLDWGPASPMNLLLQQDIDENVDYPPIFASGHAFDAGVIALAGAALGNLVVSLGLGLAACAIARKRSSTFLACFSYWLVTMSIGNLLSYVPLRVFATHADMSTVQHGFGWTPLQVLLFVGVPFFAAAAWFFLSFQPRAIRALFPDSVARRYVMMLLTSLTVFGFFALGGMFGYGETSHELSLAFMLGLGPLSLCLGMFLTRAERHRSPGALHQ
ncbi:MAG: hypothetical protein ABWX83_05030 [Luteibacter sp.]